MARAGMDDAYLCGAPNEVFPVLEKLKVDTKRECGLELQMTKTEIYSLSGAVPNNAPPGLIRAGEELESVWEPGFLCYGVPIGSDKYVEYMLDCKIKEIADDITKIEETLTEHRQAMWNVLRSSLNQKLDYWLTLVYPSQMVKAAEKMDKLLKNCLDHLIGDNIPLDNSEEKSWVCPINIPVDGQNGRSFQSWIMRQPIRMGGLGMRSQEEICSFAFIGGVEQALPHFTHGDRICPQLEDIIGNFEETPERWKKMIDSGCRTGREFATAWQKLKHELQQHADYLGQEPTLGPLSEDVHIAGKTVKMVAPGNC